MRADDVTEKEVMAVLTKFTEYFSKRDLEGSLSLIAPDEDVTVFCLEPDERRVGLSGIKEQFERDWSHTDAISIELIWNSVSSAGLVAWVASEAFIKIKSNLHSMILPTRITSVLEKRGDKWLIVQGHFSVPDLKHDLNSF
jgi:ketosteroid isomerase-like protein